MRFPRPLAPGDRVFVVAPASPFDPRDLDRGLAWLRERYEVVVGSAVLSRTGYLAGTDADRARDLADAMRDPETRAIVAARGGYGAMRLVDALPWDAWAARPSWLVGFSDITALHVEAQRRGVASIHGPHVTGVGRDEHATVRAAWRDALEAPAAPRVWSGLRVVHAGVGGVAHGPIVGGNLALVTAMAAGGRFAIPDGSVLALEDVTERPYRIDRMLTSLRLSGVLARVSAIVLGDFDKCDPGPDGVLLGDVLAEGTAGLGVPVLAGAPFGHAARNDAFVLGAPVTVTAGAVRFGGE
jgi:muramoyltetrapeptide carboxypeptidase